MASWRAGDPWSPLPGATAQRRSGWHLADSLCVTSGGGETVHGERLNMGGQWGVLGDLWGPGSEAA